jgi:molybdate transport system substrate-binding protein
MNNSLRALGYVVVFLYYTFGSVPAFAIHSISVLADNTIDIALAELARDYSRSKQVIVNTSFASKAMHDTQILEGGAADILITSQPFWIEELKNKGLIDVASRTTIASNQLALVGPLDNTLDIKIEKYFPTAALIKQMANEPMFVVANPGTQIAGIYGKEALRTIGASDDLEPYTLYIREPSQMIGMVSKQNAYGVFLNSTVARRSDVQVLDIFPTSSHQPITYFAVVIAGDNMEEARNFLAYLQQASAKKILKRNGFIEN